VKSAADLGALARQRTWDKELLLWRGTEDGLREALAPLTIQTLDLLDLFDEHDLPMDDEETREQLLRGMQKAFRSLRPGPERRVVLALKSIGLLARYRTGLSALYDWFLGDFSMAILILEGSGERVSWPEEVRCDPDRLLESFTLSEAVKDVYEEME
jgi:hypothetical protein